MKKKRKPATRLFLGIRSYPDSAMCDVWLILREGHTESGLMHGKMFASRAYALANRLKLAVQYELSPFNFARPKPSPKGNAKCAAAQLIATGFFDEPTEAKAAFAELKRRGGRWAMPSVSNFCRSYAGRGFLTIEPDGYQAVQGMKINIKK